MGFYGRRSLILAPRPSDDVAAPFAPTDITPLYFWFASRLEAYNDNDAMGTWNDQSASNNDATAGTGVEPTFKTNIINSLPVARFDGTADYFTLPTIDMTGTSAVEVWIVMSATSGTLRAVYEHSTNYNTPTTGFLVSRDNGNQVSMGIKGDVGYSGFQSTATLTTTAKLIRAQADKSLATNECTTWLNGATAGTRSQNNNNTNAFGSHAGYIGARFGAGTPSLYLAGDIAEILCFGKALDAGEVTNMETYLNDLYNLY